MASPGILDRVHTVKYTYKNGSSHTHYNISMIAMRHARMRTLDTNPRERPYGIEVWLHSNEWLEVYNSYLAPALPCSIHPSTNIDNPIKLN
jgi:hypothetical protein